jgi:hypothetical protein
LVPEGVISTAIDRSGVEKLSHLAAPARRKKGRQLTFRKPLKTFREVNFIHLKVATTSAMNRNDFQDCARPYRDSRTIA